MRTPVLLTTAAFFLAPQISQAQEYRQKLSDDMNYCAAQEKETVPCYQALAQDSFEIIVFFRDLTWVMEEKTLLNPTREQVAKAREFTALSEADRYRVAYGYFNDMVESGQSLASLEDMEPLEALEFITMSGDIVREVFTYAVSFIGEHEGVDDYTGRQRIMEDDMFPRFKAELRDLWQRLEVSPPLRGRTH